MAGNTSDRESVPARLFFRERKPPASVGRGSAGPVPGDSPGGPEVPSPYYGPRRARSSFPVLRAPGGLELPSLYGLRRARSSVPG